MRLGPRAVESYCWRWPRPGGCGRAVSGRYLGRANRCGGLGENVPAEVTRANCALVRKGDRCDNRYKISLR